MSSGIGALVARDCGSEPLVGAWKGLRRPSLALAPAALLESLGMARVSHGTIVAHRRPARLSLRAVLRPRIGAEIKTVSSRPTPGALHVIRCCSHRSGESSQRRGSTGPRGSEHARASFSNWPKRRFLHRFPPLFLVRASGARACCSPKKMRAAVQHPGVIRACALDVAVAGGNG